MNKVIIIAQNTFRESVRDKVLYNLLFFAILMVIASVLIAELSLDQDKLIITRMGLTVMLFFGALISIFIGTGLVYKEIDKRTVYSMLAKPISRGEFVVGKFLGLSFTLLVNCVTMLMGTSLALIYLNNFQIANVSWHFLTAGFLLFLELLIIIGFSLMFSAFSSPALSALFSIVIYIIGSLSQDILLFARTTPSVILKSMARFFYYVVPNFSNFNYITAVAHGNAVPVNNFLLAIGYATIYLSILLIVSITIFKQRNFK
jgi:ABC-type transport system involved in multi-copper enzyme maturation permease subunit